MLLIFNFRRKSKKERPNISKMLFVCCHYSFIRNLMQLGKLSTHQIFLYYISSVNTSISLIMLFDLSSPGGLYILVIPIALAILRNPLFGLFMPHPCVTRWVSFPQNTIIIYSKKTKGNKETFDKIGCGNIWKVCNATQNLTQKEKKNNNNYYHHEKRNRISVREGKGGYRRSG